MIRPKLRQLEYLVAIDNEKSFSKAALACNVTQSTLSTGIKELEDILGQSLVNRASRHITLTPTGDDIALQARAILQDVDAIVTRAQASQNPLSSTIRLGFIPTIAPYVLPKILPEMDKNFPDLHLELYEDLSERLIDMVHKRQIDAAVLAFPYETKGLDEREIMEEDFLLAVPKNREIPASLRITDVKPEELLLLEDGHCLRDHALSACNLQLPARRKTFSATSLATLLQLVDHGFGITLLPEMVVNNAPISKGIKLKPFADKQKPKRKIGIVWLKNTPTKRDLETLYAQLIEILA